MQRALEELSNDGVGCKNLWRNEKKYEAEAEAETKASKVKERFLGNSVELDSTLSYSWIEFWNKIFNFQFESKCLTLTQKTLSSLVKWWSIVIVTIWVRIYTEILIGLE